MNREVYSASASDTPVGSFLRRASANADPSARDVALTPERLAAYAAVIRTSMPCEVPIVPEMKFVVSLIALIALALAAPAIAATQVDINSADARTLAQSLDGVGLSKAEAIVAYRKNHGPFRTLEDLARVDGIGPRIIEENRSSIVFGNAPARRGGPATNSMANP